MDERGIIQNRRSQRANLWMAASLEHDGQVLPVTLRNLSADGALVEGDHGLQPGAQIVFCRQDLKAEGLIAWVADRRAGIAFAMSLDPETVLRQIPSPRPICELHHKRLGFRGRLVEQERRIGESLWHRPLPTAGK